MFAMFHRRVMYVITVTFLQFINVAQTKNTSTSVPECHKYTSLLSKQFLKSNSLIYAAWANARPNVDGKWSVYIGTERGSAIMPESYPYVSSGISDAPGQLFLTKERNVIVFYLDENQRFSAVNYSSESGIYGGRVITVHHTIDQTFDPRYFDVTKIFAYTDSDFNSGMTMFAGYPEPLSKCQLLVNYGRDAPSSLCESGKNEMKNKTVVCIADVVSETLIHYPRDPHRRLHHGLIKGKRFGQRELNPLRKADDGKEDVTHLLYIYGKNEEPTCFEMPPGHMFGLLWQTTWNTGRNDEDLQISHAAYNNCPLGGSTPSFVLLITMLVVASFLTALMFAIVYIERKGNGVRRLYLADLKRLKQEEDRRQKPSDVMVEVPENVPTPTNDKRITISTSAAHD